jgi:hypothetical protein
MTLAGDARLLGVHDATSAQARCRLTLIDPTGKQVAFNGVLKANGEDRLRIRTWVFTRPVVDITLTPEGLWVAVGSVVKTSDRIELEASAKDIASAWSLFVGDPASWGAPFNPAAHNEAATRDFMAPNIDGTATLTVVDQSMLVPLRYELHDASGAVLRTLSLGQYRAVNGYAWPHCMTLRSDQGTIIIAMSAVKVNVELQPNAFDPPVDARRLE